MASCEFASNLLARLAADLTLTYVLPADSNSGRRTRQSQRSGRVKMQSTLRRMWLCLFIINLKERSRQKEAPAEKNVFNI
jgi:hypothetical protein